MNRQPSNKMISGAELRRRAADRLAAQHVIPNGEAGRREQRLLGRLAEAAEDWRWIMGNSAWTQLGFDTFTAWYLERVKPVADRLGLRPTPEMAWEIAEQVRVDESLLPKSQQRLQKELADLAGVSPSTLLRNSQDRSQASSGAGSDLDDASTRVPAEDEVDDPELGGSGSEVASGPGVADRPGPDAPGAPEERTEEQDTLSPQWARERLAELRGEAPMPAISKPRKGAPIDHLADYQGDVWCKNRLEGDETVIGVKMATCQACLQALVDSSPAPTGEAPAGTDELAEDSAVATGRPGTDIDAAVESSLPAEPPPVGELGGGDGAGSGQADAAPSGVESGVAAPDSGVEGEAVAGPPFTDPVSMFVRRQIAEHDRFMADFVVLVEDLGVGELAKLRQLHAERGHVLGL
jgi:hypothetical protein